MKTILALAVFLSFTGIQAQNKTKLQSALDIFQMEVTPYIQELVDREYGTHQDSPGDQEAAHSRLLLLKAKTSAINRDVTAALLNTSPADVKLISKTISHYYKDVYTGLRKEFFDHAEAGVQKL